MKPVHIKGDIDLLSKNSLSILITQDGLSYSIYDIDNNKMLALVSKQFSANANRCEEIKQFLTDEEVLQFENVNVVYATKSVTIVPDAIFEESQGENIFALNRRIADDEKILFSKLPKSQTVLIYSAKKEIINLLDCLFTRYSICPQSHTFIESGLTRTKISEKPNSPRMFVQVFEDFFDVLVIDKAQICNYNTYSYKSSNDILYFIVNTFEQLGMSQEECEVVFSGFIEPDDLAVIHLKKFVRNVYFESINRDYKYFYHFQEFAPHYFYNFINAGK